MWLVCLRNWTFNFFNVNEFKFKQPHKATDSHTGQCWPKICHIVPILTLENGTYYGIKTGHGIYKFNSFFMPWATGNIFKDQDNNYVFAYLISDDELMSLILVSEQITN